MGESKGPEASQEGLGGHFRLVTFATSISRITGFVRDQLNAALFGAGWMSDAYFMAVRIPSLLRDLFAEGALSNAFIPSLTSRLGNREDAWKLASQVFSLFLLVTGGISALGILFAPQIVWVIAHGFIQAPDKFTLTVELTRYLFPVLTFVCMYALWMGTLNSLQKFTWPAFAPVFMNLTQIVAGILLLKVFKAATPLEELRNVRLWTLSMTLGMLFQWIVQIPAAGKQGVKFRWLWPPRHPGVGEMLRLMGPVVLSSSVLQVNILVNQFFASFLATGYVSYLYYGQRLFQLPYGIFGVSIATVIFPILALQSSQGKDEEFSDTLSKALSAGIFVMVPCTVGIWITARSAIHLAFEYGRFSPEAGQATAEATAIYALGLVGYTGVKVLQSAFYARKNSKIPVASSLCGMGINVGLNLMVFLFIADLHWRFWGLVLASAVGSTVNFIWLLTHLRKIKVALHWAFLAGESVKVLLCTAVMGLAAWFVAWSLVQHPIIWPRLTNFLCPVLIGGAIYYLLARWMKMNGLEWILGRRRREPQQ
jgi:putative peptidoglycan lipid II flippase